MTNSARTDEPGRQMDDNIDDMGRKPDGSTLDQPGTGDDAWPPQSEDNDKETPDKKEFVPGSDADSDDQALGV